MNDAEKVLNILSQTQLDFIENEIGISGKQIKSMTDDAVSDLYDKICEIEIEETCAAERQGGSYSDRGLLAEGIVTVIGNALYRPEQDEFEDESE